MRTYPLTAFTLDFYIKPEGPRKQRQAVITRRGWSGGVDVFLLPDGKLELVRNGNESTPKETLLSRTPIPEKRWTNIRIVHDESSLELYLDGKLDAKRTIVPARSYGNCTWFLGGNGKANFTGLLDDVTILGIPARPGSPLYPPLPAPEKRSDIADLYGTTLKAVPEKRSCRNGRRRDRNRIQQQLSIERQKALAFEEPAPGRRMRRRHHTGRKEDSWRSLHP